jgi:hypothetical protein
MIPASIVELADVLGKPKVKMDLPSPMRIGDKVKLRFHLSRQNGGRSEVLDVNGDFQVRGVSFEMARQCLSVESLGAAPAWRAVKKTLSPVRKLGPARVPPMVIE